MHPEYCLGIFHEHWSTQLYSSSAEEGALLEITCLELLPTGARPPPQRLSVGRESWLPVCVPFHCSIMDLFQGCFSLKSKN